MVPGAKVGGRERPVGCITPPEAVLQDDSVCVSVLRSKITVSITWGSEKIMFRVY